jgi:ATP-binding cassette subfamily F protein 3
VERSKIAFVGQNGQGKSTFIKAIVNEFEYEGDIKAQCTSRLFAQNQADLDGEILYFKLWRMHRYQSSKVRDMLGSFSFVVTM